MKKIFLVLSFLLVFNFTKPTTTSASSKLDNENELMGYYTKRVSQWVQIGDGEYPPVFSKTFYYNDGVYSGTLSFSYMERRLGPSARKRYVWYALYSGTVTGNISPIQSREILVEVD